jgi:hypothetical protein
MTAIESLTKEGSLAMMKFPLAVAAFGTGLFITAATAAPKLF